MDKKLDELIKDIAKKHPKKENDTKIIKIQFNNKYDELESTETFDLIVPSEITQKDIENEYNILKRCSDMLNKYSCENITFEILKKYNVENLDYEIAKIVLDGGDCDIIATSFLDFVLEKHSWHYNPATITCDMEIDIR